MGGSFDAGGFAGGIFSFLINAMSTPISGPTNPELKEGSSSTGTKVQILTVTDASSKKETVPAEEEGDEDEGMGDSLGFDLGGWDETTHFGDDSLDSMAKKDIAGAMSAGAWFKKYKDDLQQYLGNYHDRSGPAFVSDNPLQYSDIDYKLGGIGEALKDLSPEGLAQSLSSGTPLIGSYKINVWGPTPEQGSYWTAYRYQNVAPYVDGGTISPNNWVPLSYEQALPLDITQETLDTFMQR